MKSFPFKSDQFQYDFGIRALPAGQTPFPRTNTHETEIALKRELLRHHLDEVFALLPGYEAESLEVADWVNRQAEGSTTHGSPDGSPAQTFLAACQRVQQDVAILANQPHQGYPIIGGVVTFPSGWSIADKLNQSVATTHGDVPGFTEHLLDRTTKLFDSIKPGRTVVRHNWMINPSDRLAQLPSIRETVQQERLGLTANNAGERGHFRVEVQTLSRMPQTGAIVFTIQTEQTPLAELTADQRQRLAGALRTCPPAVLRYKRLDCMVEALLSYLGNSTDTLRSGFC